MSGYKCINCEDGPCITDKGPLNNDRCIPKWERVDNIQITETPEPVHVLYIPEQMLGAVSSYLSNRNGLNVVIVSKSDGFVTFETTRAPGEADYVSRCWVVPKSWLKQKPAKPTADELQIRLDAIRFVTGGVSEGAQKVIADLANGK